MKKAWIRIRMLLTVIFAAVMAAILLFLLVRAVGKTLNSINGDRDYQTNYMLAQEYFEEVTAPGKGLYIMENTTHGLLESKSDAFPISCMK